MVLALAQVTFYPTYLVSAFQAYQVKKQAAYMFRGSFTSKEGYDLIVVLKL